MLPVSILSRYAGRMLYHEYRCHGCQKLLFKGVLVDSEVEVKCRACGSLSTFHGTPKEKLLCFKESCIGRKTRSDAAKEAKDLVG